MSNEVFIDGDADAIQLRVQANTTQTNPLQTWEQSDGSALAQVTGDGRLELGDLDLGTPDALIEANRDITLPSSVPERGVQSRGLIRGAISNAIAWAVHELELLGDGGVSGLHAALRAKISQKNTGDADLVDLRAGDFEAINEAGSYLKPVGNLTGVQSTVTNEQGAYLNEAVGMEVQINDDNPPGQITGVYGVRVGNLPAGSSETHAIHTGEGSVHVGDDLEVKVFDNPPAENPPGGFVKVYPKLDAGSPKLWAKDSNGIEHELGGGGGATQLSDLTDVNSSAPTNGNILRADGVDWESVSGETHFVPKQPTSDIFIDSNQHNLSISGRLCQTLLSLNTTNDVVAIGSFGSQRNAYLRVLGSQQIYDDGTNPSPVHLDINANDTDPVLRLTGHHEGPLMPRIETQIGRGQPALPDLVQDHDPLLLISAGGYGGDSGYPYAQATWILSEVDGDVGPYVPGRLRFLTSDGSDVLPAGGQMVLDSRGRVGINKEYPTAQLEAESSDAARIAFVARAESGQTANVRETQDANGTLLEGADKDGATVQKAQSSTPATPSAGYRKLYPKSDGWYDLNSAGQETKIGGSAPIVGLCDGRLTLSSGTPIPTTDVLAATTLYFTPFRGNQVALFDGTKWSLFPFTERSLSLSGLAANTLYDIFLYDNSGTLTLEAVAWTNDTTRATALVKQDGIYVKTGDATRRYLGTIRTTTAGQTEDSATKRYVYNENNQVPRKLKVVETVGQWTYNTSAWRAANNNVANRVGVVIGNVGPLVSLDLMVRMQGAGSGAVQGMAYDAVNTNHADVFPNVSINSLAASHLRHYPAIGYHYYQWVENGRGQTTNYMYGYAAGAYQSGIVGEVML